MSKPEPAGIRLVTGAIGHGKTFYAMKKLIEALHRGLYVATNIELVEGWEYAVARMTFSCRLSRDRLEARAAELRAHYYLVREFSDLRRMRIPACGTCAACRNGRGCRTEGRGVAVLDEAHIWMNARTWNVDTTGRRLSQPDAVMARADQNKFFAQHRKIGWRVYLISQGEGQLDSQVRGLQEIHVFVKNLKRLSAWWNPIRWSPFPVFVAISIWGGDKQGTRIATECFLLDRTVANLYDTTSLHELEPEDAGDLIWLGGVADNVRQLRAAPEPACVAEPAAGGAGAAVEDEEPEDAQLEVVQSTTNHGSASAPGAVPSPQAAVETSPQGESVAFGDTLPCAVDGGSV